MMILPLTQWTLHGENLPDRLLNRAEKPSFSLPGADALSAFANLIGGEAPSSAPEKNEGVPYIAGSLFEADIEGGICLKREIDFGSMTGDFALLAFEHIAGSGSIRIGESELARFGGDSVQALCQASDLTGMPCGLCVDVTQWLMLGKRETIEVQFDDARGAGMCGAAFLRVASHAHLSRVSIQPDAIRHSMTIRARINAHHAGRYVLRAQAIPSGTDAVMTDARETSVMLDTSSEKTVQIAMEVAAPAFVPGRSYAAPAMKIQLFYRPENTKGFGFVCDDALLMCGYGSSAPRAWLPVSGEMAVQDPDALCKKIKELGITAVSLDTPAPDKFYRALCREGIAAVEYISEDIRPLFTRYPCLTLADFSPEQQEVSLAAAAWQMMGSVAYPRAIDATLSPREMLDEVSGKRLDLDSEGVKNSLSWLRTVQIRLRAEAVRQGRYQGAICSMQDLESDDVCDALRTAFAPLHLSALPLSGAWWTGTRFSASLEAFIPRDVFLWNGTLDALAVLEDEDGTELARLEAKCSREGYLGVIEYPLGDKPCVLTLSCQLTRAGDVLEQSVMPVYVGDRGPLEAAF